MEIEVNKTKIDEARARSGIKPLLYDLRRKTNHSNSADREFKTELYKLDPQYGSLSALRQTQPNTRKQNLENAKLFHFYRTKAPFLNKNFETSATIDCIPRPGEINNQPLTHPRFPFRSIEEMTLPDNLSEEEKRLLHILQLEEDKINDVEKETRKQADSQQWKEERKFRFTASNFHLISKRQRNHDNFAETLINPKPVSSKYRQCRLKFEPIAPVEYKKFMYNRRTPVKVLPYGFVASKATPIIGVSPDARVVDCGCADHFGIAEVKCPYTKQHVTPLDACRDENFFMEKISETEFKLKEDHASFAQVQGQMSVTGARWCDFVVYTTRGLYVQRVPFNPDFWTELHQKLVSKELVKKYRGVGRSIWKCG